jgi:phosphatidate cytidylyltransferase
MAAPKSMTSLPPARRFDWSNLRLRVLSAAVLAPIAVLSAWVGGPAFLIVVAMATALLSGEWAKMSAPRSSGRAALAMTAAVIVALTPASSAHFGWAWVLAVAGALVCALLSALRRNDDRPIDEAFGVLYIGAPAIALVWLRSGAPGRAYAMALLASAWAADIAAFGAGNLLGGVKLWPKISPNKTWSGFIAGLAAAVAAAEAVAISPAGQGGPSAPTAWLVGLVVGLATMAGDLWESMLKRRFGVKDSGDLIPGHGGLLDRVDGLMFATLALAGVRMLVHFGAFPR